jgi:single-strand DNA-binding protein
MEDVNHTVQTGNLTADPEEVSTNGGTAIAKIRIAVNGRRKKGEEWVDDVNFFNVKVFGTHAENALLYLTKGRKVLVDGRLDWSEWEAKDGSGKRQAVEIIAAKLTYLGAPKQTEGEAEPEMAGVGASGGGEDDIPY